MTKTLFGQYSGKRAREWDDIIRSYEKDSIYLAELAEILITYVNYDM